MRGVAECRSDCLRLGDLDPSAIGIEHLPSSVIAIDTQRRAVDVYDKPTILPQEPSDDGACDEHNDVQRAAVAK